MNGENEIGSDATAEVLTFRDVQQHLDATDAHAGALEALGVGSASTTSAASEQVITAQRGVAEMSEMRRQLQDEAMKQHNEQLERIHAHRAAMYDGDKLPEEEELLKLQREEEVLRLDQLRAQQERERVFQELQAAEREQLHAIQDSALRDLEALRKQREELLAREEEQQQKVNQLRHDIVAQERDHDQRVQHLSNKQVLWADKRVQSTQRQKAVRAEMESASRSHEQRMAQLSATQQRDEQELATVSTALQRTVGRRPERSAERQTSTQGGGGEQFQDALADFVQSILKPPVPTAVSIVAAGASVADANGLRSSSSGPQQDNAQETLVGQIAQLERQRDLRLKELQERSQASQYERAQFQDGDHELMRGYMDTMVTAKRSVPSPAPQEGSIKGVLRQLDAEATVHAVTALGSHGSLETEVQRNMRMPSPAALGQDKHSGKDSANAPPTEPTAGSDSGNGKDGDHRAPTLSATDSTPVGGSHAEAQRNDQEAAHVGDPALLDLVAKLAQTVDELKKERNDRSPAPPSAGSSSVSLAQEPGLRSNGFTGSVPSTELPPAMMQMMQQQQAMMQQIEQENFRLMNELEAMRNGAMLPSNADFGGLAGGFGYQGSNSNTLDSTGQGLLPPVGLGLMPLPPGSDNALPSAAFPSGLALQQQPSLAGQQPHGIAPQQQQQQPQQPQQSQHELSEADSTGPAQALAPKAAARVPPIGNLQSAAAMAIAADDAGVAVEATPPLSFRDAAKSALASGRDGHRINPNGGTVKNSRLHVMSMKHQEEMARLKFEMERLKQERELADFREQLTAERAAKEKQQEHDAWLEEQKRALQTLRVQQALAREEQLLHMAQASTAAGAEAVAGVGGNASSNAANASAGLVVRDFNHAEGVCVAWDFVAGLGSLVQEMQRRNQTAGSADRTGSAKPPAGLLNLEQLVRRAAASGNSQDKAMVRVTCGLFNGQTPCGAMQSTPWVPFAPQDPITGNLTPLGGTAVFQDVAAVPQTVLVWEVQATSTSASASSSGAPPPRNVGWGVAPIFLSASSGGSGSGRGSASAEYNVVPGFYYSAVLSGGVDLEGVASMDVGFAAAATPRDEHRKAVMSRQRSMTGGSDNRKRSLTSDPPTPSSLAQSAATKLGARVRYLGLDKRSAAVVRVTSLRAFTVHEAPVQIGFRICHGQDASRAGAFHVDVVTMRKLFVPATGRDSDSGSQSTKSPATVQRQASTSALLRQATELRDGDEDFGPTMETRGLDRRDSSTFRGVGNVGKAVARMRRHSSSMSQTVVDNNNHDEDKSAPSTPATHSSTTPARDQPQFSGPPPDLAEGKTDDLLSDDGGAVEEKSRGRAENDALESGFAEVAAPPLPRKTFARGDGVDIYVDGARFLPYNTTLTRCVLKLFTADGEQFGKTAEKCCHPLRSVSNPVFMLRTELRADALNPTMIAVVRVDTIDIHTKAARGVGYAVLKLFQTANRSQPDRPTAQSFYLNEGAFQIPLLTRPPKSYQDMREADILETSIRLPCASLLVRIVEAPKSPDGLNVLSVDDTPELQWDALGLMRPAPPYESRVYSSVTCMPSTAERNLYRLRVQDERSSPNRTVRATCAQLGLKSEGDNAEAPIVRDDAHVDEFNRWAASTIPPRVSSMIEHTYFAKVSAAHGFKVAIDALHNMPDPGLFGKLDMYKVIYSVAPPGLYYGSDPLAEEVRFTVDTAKDSSARAPEFLDGFHRYRQMLLQESSVLVLDVRSVRVGKPARGQTDLSVEVQPPSARKSQWALLPLIRHTEFINAGVFQVPLVRGSVVGDVVRAADPMEELLRRLALRKGEDGALSLSDGSSVIVRVQHSLVENFLTKHLDADHLDTSILDDMCAADGTRADKFQYDPLRMAGVKSVGESLPGRAEPKDAFNVINKAFAKATNIDIL